MPYVWICLNNSIEAYSNISHIQVYDWISAHIPENRVLNMPEFWMGLLQYIASGHCTNYWAGIETDMHSEHCETFKMERFAKRIIPECRCATTNFSGQEVGEVCGTKIRWYRFRQKHQKMSPRRETFWSLFS